MASYNQLVDMYGSKNIDGKTVLNILDGPLFRRPLEQPAAQVANSALQRPLASSFFASQDPVAIESVGPGTS